MDELIDTKIAKNTITGNAIKLVEAISDKIDGALTHIAKQSLTILEYCINPVEGSLSCLDSKLLNSRFFTETTPGAKF